MDLLVPQASRSGGDAGCQTSWQTRRQRWQDLREFQAQQMLLSHGQAPCNSNARLLRPAFAFRLSRLALQLPQSSLQCTPLFSLSGPHLRDAELKAGTDACVGGCVSRESSRGCRQRVVYVAMRPGISVGQLEEGGKDDGEDALTRLPPCDSILCALDDSHQG